MANGRQIEPYRWYSLITFLPTAVYMVKFPMDFELQLGDKLSHPQELTFG